MAQNSLDFPVCLLYKIKSCTKANYKKYINKILDNLFPFIKKASQIATSLILISLCKQNEKKLL